MSSPEQKPTVPMADSQHECDGCDDQRIDNSVKVLEKIAGLYAERLLSDIALEVNGRQYASHRLILCASSDVFQVMLMNPIWTESQEKTIVLQEEADCAKVFPEFLKYLYTGCIKINHNLVLPLASLADKYNVRDLVALCVEYMRKHMVSAGRHQQLVSWLQYVLASDHPAVARALTDFVAWNFESVSLMADFCTLETEVLIHFLKKSDLVVTDEYSLLMIVTKWLTAQERRLHTEFFDPLVPLVLSYIRFPMIEPNNLAKLLINPLMLRFKEFFVQHMSLAMQYHSSGLSPELKSQLSPYSFTPRLYTTEKWSSSLMIEGYDNLPVYGVRTLVFNTPPALSEWEARRKSVTGNAKTCAFSDGQSSYEWAIEVYPKGIWFKKYLWIHWRGSLEMPEWVSKTVRLTVRQTEPCVRRRVSIGVLLSAKLDGIEHIERVVRTQYIFTPDDKLVNLDDIIPFDELNESRANASVRDFGHTSAASVGTASTRSPYLTGKESDTLKIQVIITPLSDDCI